MNEASAPRDLPDDAGAADRYTVPALERGLRLLGEFSRDNRRLGAPELARRLGLPRSTVFRLLATLESMGFIERVDGSTEYRLGLAVLRLGFEYLASLELTQLGQPLLERLCDAVRLPCNLVVRDGRSIVYVLKAMPPTPLSSAVSVGTRLPAHATVLGRILLEDLSLEQLRELYPEAQLETHSPSTPRTVRELHEMVARDRQRGYVLGEGFFEASISTIAAPVRDHGAHIVAALGVTIPSAHVEPGRLDELVGRVRDTADELSRLLNYCAPASAADRKVVALGLSRTMNQDGFDLAGRTAAITGASGIGLATADLFLGRGAAVAICGRDAQRLARAEAQLRERHPGARLHAAVCDVLDAGSVARFAASSEAALGPAAILVNNAGQGRVSTFATTTDEAWNDELHLKFYSVIRPTRAFLPQLERQAAALGDAAIVCSNSLLAAQPEPHMVATSAARAGVKNLVRSLATEFAPKRVRVNAILIGLIESGQWRRRFDARPDPAVDWAAWTARLADEKHIPLGRLGLPEEAARALYFLASPMSSYTTGSHLDVSGGHSRHA